MVECYFCFGKDSVEETVLFDAQGNQKTVPCCEKCFMTGRVFEQDREILYKLSSPVTEVHSSCRTCGTPFAMIRSEGTYTTNLFCISCDRQYWVDWEAGVLHMGLDNHDELYSRMMDRLTGTLRMNGVGRRIL